MTDDVCAMLAKWAEVADVRSAAGGGTLAIWKSDLLSRMVYGGEKGPSLTPCPVHEGVWSGMSLGWPWQVWVEYGSGNERPVDLNPLLVEQWADGCRCSTHQGSTSSTGWQPDEHCGCADGEFTQELWERAERRLLDHVKVDV